MTRNARVPNPSKYDVWPDKGFLPKLDPLEKLPYEYNLINDTATNLPALLRAGQLRAELDRLPIIDLSGLETQNELECAMRSYSFFASAYVYAAYQETSNRIPAGVAVPLHCLAKRLDRRPILSYNSYGPQNWRRIDKNGPVALGNIEVIQNFLGGKDENGFILDHVPIEANAAPALLGAPKAQSMAFTNNEEGLNETLLAIALSLEKMVATLARMPDLCDPDIYYREVRPYIHAFRGVVYEGVGEYDGKPQSFLGETGAQSSIVPCLYAVLGIEHVNDPLLGYLAEMRKYMPVRHRQFIVALERNKSIVRKWALDNKTSDPDCAVAYDKCVFFLWKFLKMHFGYADRYIHQQTQTSSSNPTCRGTGGTPFMEYLNKHVEETLAHMIW
jgi:indoleamine 2,3-dioxygenase